MERAMLSLKPLKIRREQLEVRSRLSRSFADMAISCLTEIVALIEQLQYYFVYEALLF
jgi:hypothetical protein